MQLIDRPAAWPMLRRVIGRDWLVGPGMDDLATAATESLDQIEVVAADADGRLLGAVTVDDVLDHLLPDDWREDRHEVTTHG